MISAHHVLTGLLSFLTPRERAEHPVAQSVPTLDAVAILDAIAAVETENAHWLVGRGGERGRCQFLHTTWARYTNADFAAWASRDTELTRRVERAHLAHLLRVLFQPGESPDPALIAAGWRFGERAATAQIRSDYARRVANLYWDAVAAKGAAR